MAKVLLKFKNTIINEFLLGSEPLLIGRTEDNSITIDNLGVSRHHAQIVKNNNEFFIEDLGSQNGTVVNSLPIKRCALRNKDQITIGKHILIFLENDAEKIGEQQSAPTQRRPMPVDLPPEETLKLGTRKTVSADGSKQKERIKDSPSIKVIEGAASPKEITLEKVLIIAGKGANADLLIEDDDIPDVVFIISSRPTGFFLSPSSNVKILVDEEMITEVVPLRDNATIQFKNVKIKFTNPKF